MRLLWARIWLRQLFEEIGLGEIVHDPTLVYGDNNVANRWASDDRITSGNMWILQCYHYVKELCEGGENLINVKYVASANNLADLFTKGVSKETFHALQPYLCGSNKLTHLLQRMIKDQGGQSS